MSIQEEIKLTDANSFNFPCDQCEDGVMFRSKTDLKTCIGKHVKLCLENKACRIKKKLHEQRIKIIKSNIKLKDI